MSAKNLLDGVNVCITTTRNMQQRNTDVLLDQVFRRIEALREAQRRFSDQLAPQFRIFDYLRTDEYGFSRCLADLMDPHGKHGQGGIFLNFFLKRIESAEWAIHDKCTKVSLERLTDQGRRIDISLDFSQGVIGIENKPWAGDQHEQLSHYADYLRLITPNGNWLLLFLSNREPSVASLAEDKLKKLTANRHFARVTFHELLSWLEECAQHSKALTVRIFIEELAKFVRTNINGELDVSEEEEIRKSILSSAENLESALLISRSMPTIKSDLIRQFQSDIGNKINIMHKPYKVIWDKDFHWGGKHSGFSFSLLKEQDKYLWFEFDGGFRGLKWGICRASEAISRNETVWNEINLIMTTAFRGGSVTDDWWAWYSKDAELGEDFSDWTVSAKPWQEILGGTLADRFIAIVDKVYALFEDRQHLLMPAQTAVIKSSS